MVLTSRLHVVPDKSRLWEIWDGVAVSCGTPHSCVNSRLEVDLTRLDIDVVLVIDMLRSAGASLMRSRKLVIREIDQSLNEISVKETENWSASHCVNIKLEKTNVAMVVKTPKFVFHPELWLCTWNVVPSMKPTSPLWRVGREGFQAIHDIIFTNGVKKQFWLFCKRNSLNETRFHVFIFTLKWSTLRVTFLIATIWRRCHHCLSK